MSERDYTTTNIPLDMAERIDRVFGMAGYANRSEFIRDAVREKLEQVEERCGKR